MSPHDTWLLVIAAILVVLAGVFSSIDAALTSFSKVRAEELVAEGKGGAKRLLEILQDPPRYVNTALFLRMLFEITAIVLVAEVLLGDDSGVFDERWLGILATAGVMLVVSFVVIGVALQTPSLTTGCASISLPHIWLGHCESCWQRISSVPTQLAGQVPPGMQSRMLAQSSPSRRGPAGRQ